jgi:O-antigen/teichoic acid export membrane protein
VRRSLHTAGKNLGVLLASHVLNRLLYIVLVGGIARFLGAEVLGGYALAVAVGTGFLFATDLGLSPMLTREAAAEPGRARSHYARALGAKLVASALALALLGLLLATLPYGRRVLELCALMTLAAILESFSQLNNAVCRARERMELEAVAAGGQAIVTVGASLWVLLAALPPVWLGWAAVAGSAAELVVSTLLARRLLPLGVELPPRWSTLREAGPYAVASLNAASFFQLDLLVLSLIVDQASVGEFASVSRLLQGAGYLAVLAGSSILPTLAIDRVRGDPDAFRAAGSLLLRTSLVVGGGALVVALASAHAIVPGIYGSGFARVAPLLQLGGIYLLIKCVSEALSVLLAASGRQSRSAGGRVLGAACTCALILLLAPRIGITGAVLALALGEGVAWLWQALRSRDLLRPAALSSDALRLLVSIGGAGCVWAWLRASGLPALAIVMPPLAYGALLLASGQIGWKRLSKA